MAFYSSRGYWNQRYTVTREDKPCEWYRDYHQLRRYLDPHTMGTLAGDALRVPQPSQKWNYFPSKDNCRILILGCGNSTMGEDMMRDGWSGQIVNVDFSDILIAQLKAKYTDAYYTKVMEKLPTNRMQFICADMTSSLPFAPESFDLVICKGSFDAVLNGPKSNLRLVVSEIHRILSSRHGIFFLVTCGNADSRLEYLEHNYNLNYYWQGVSVHSVPSGAPKPQCQSFQDKSVYAFVCRKHTGSNDKENGENKMDQFH